jgi:pimeloyl-ACP methyl ester carboxylesterase
MKIVLALALLSMVAGRLAAGPLERKTCRAPDGVTIVYSVAGAGDTALVFIHGGMADRSFYAAQLEAFAARYRVIAVDLAGHGESGRDRTKWGIREFAGDVKAVVEAERLNRAILFGNSLGGPVAVEAALLLPGRVVAVVGVDTFQDLGHPDTPEYARAAEADVRRRAEAFRADYPGAIKAMVRRLFHADTDPALVAETERRMLRTPGDVASSTIASLAGYDYASSVRRLAVPLRSINGDLYPTNVAAARTVKPDFDIVVMQHVGHYPMIERPEEFNRHVASLADALAPGKR